MTTLRRGEGGIVETSAIQIEHRTGAAIGPPRTTLRLVGRGIAETTASQTETRAGSTTGLTPMPAAMTVTPLAGTGAKTIV
jgi:hypothetical protein